MRGSEEVEVVGFWDLMGCGGVKGRKGVVCVFLVLVWLVVLFMIGNLRGVWRLVDKFGVGIGLGIRMSFYVF